ncbi:uncharacterized protein ARMOST_01573 [Armillaria ostoyae]|uniref:Uncharacterized protein n=1 Tax=Armillaria ostoyae TaxID=47428 RepID=A0A284QPC8_ARMOS|nr:uncharacterized protein ARMOST_01573 [Armillaria ostoyae]
MAQEYLIAGSELAMQDNPWSQPRGPLYILACRWIDASRQASSQLPKSSVSDDVYSQRCIVRFANHAISQGLRDALMLRDVNLHGGDSTILHLITPCTASPNSVPPQTHFGRDFSQDKPWLNVNGHEIVLWSARLLLLPKVMVSEELARWNNGISMEEVMGIHELCSLDALDWMQPGTSTS